MGMAAEGVHVHAEICTVVALWLPAYNQSVAVYCVKCIIMYNMSESET